MICRVTVQFEVDNWDDMSDSELATLKRLEKLYEDACKNHIESIDSQVTGYKLEKDTKDS
jgi:hypothetical protein